MTKLGKAYKDAECTEFDKLHALEGTQGWMRIDLARGGSAKASDPYWFSPEGFRFRSRKEITRWLEGGKTVLDLVIVGPFTKDPATRARFGGMGISKEETIARGYYSAELLASAAGIPRGGGAGAGAKRSATEAGLGEVYKSTKGARKSGPPELAQVIDLAAQTGGELNFARYARMLC